MVYWNRDNDTSITPSEYREWIAMTKFVENLESSVVKLAGRVSALENKIMNKTAASS